MSDVRELSVVYKKGRNGFVEGTGKGDAAPKSSIFAGSFVLESSSNKVVEFLTMSDFFHKQFKVDSLLKRKTARSVALRDILHSFIGIFYVR